MKKFLTVLIAILTLVSLFASCSSTPSGEAPVEEGGTYKIACIAPLTGASEEHGNSYKSAIEFKIKEVNDAGGINGKMLECEFFDDKGDPKETVSVATLVTENDEFLACFGPFSSTCAIAAAPIFEEAGIVMFAPSSSHVDFTSLGDYMVRGCNTSEIQQRFYAKFLYNFHKTTKVAFLYLNDDAGNSSQEYFTKFYTELGGTVLKKESFEKDTKDFNAVLTTIKGINPEVLVVYGSYADVAAIITQSKNLEINAPIMTFGAAQQQGLLDVVGTAGDGTLIMTALDLDADTEELKAFSESYKATYDIKNINSHVINMYDGLTCFVDAVTANGADRAAIAAHMRNSSVAGVCGEYDVENGDPAKPLGVIVIDEGNFVPYRIINPEYTGNVG